MDWPAYYRRIDAQMKEAEARKGNRRRQQVPVAVERRSGKDRRGSKRAG